MEPKITNGRWTVNGKAFDKMNRKQRFILNKFFSAKKQQENLKTSGNEKFHD